MKDNLVKAVNAQINAELESAYLYLAMSARMDALSLPGLAVWLRIQWEEELVHALKFHDFLLQRDAVVELEMLAKPATNFANPLEAFESVLEHEIYISKRIWELNELAVQERDYALQSLLQWFIDEQVEEEENARAAVDSMRLIGNEGSGLYLLDKEMGARAPIADAAGPAQ